MQFSVNHWVLYVCAIGIIIFVIAQSIFFLVRALKRAKAIGMDEQKIKKVIKSSAIFTIAPAVAILVGIYILMRSLGIPTPWVRLSVVGSLSYETIIAENTLAAFGKSLSSNSSLLTAQEFVTVLLAMTVCILSGLFLSPILIKRYKKGLLNLEKKDKRWSDILMSALFLGMICGFIGDIFKKVTVGIVGWIPVFVTIASALLMVVFGLLIKKFKWSWLNDYALPLSMVGGMALAIPITNWITALVA